MSLSKRIKKNIAKSKANGVGVIEDAPSDPLADEQMVQLQNPVSQHFATFIAGNACYWEKEFAERVPMVEPDTYMRRPWYRRRKRRSGHVVICGAGPTLRDTAQEYCKPKAWWRRTASEVWGCNSAATYLYDAGLRVTHAFTVDQTAEMLGEWESAPPIGYMLASSVHPHLVEYLVEKQHAQRIRFFHNYVGIKERDVSYEGLTMSYEDWLYHSLYPPSMRSGSGLNSVTRAIDIADEMGFDRITVLGADCAIATSAPPPPDAQPGSPENLAWLAEHTTMHADGGSAVRSGATHITLHADIDGRAWCTKPDMAISALTLVQMRRKFAGRLALVGDTLPNALKDKPEEFLERLPNFVDRAGNVIPLA